MVQRLISTITARATRLAGRDIGIMGQGYACYGFDLGYLGHVVVERPIRRVDCNSERRPIHPHGCGLVLV